MRACGGFHAEEHAATPFEMKDEPFKSLPVHTPGERENLLSPFPDTACVELILGHVDSHKHVHLPYQERKKRDCSGQASMVTRAQKGPINVSGLQEAGDRLKIRVRRPRKE